MKHKLAVDLQELEIALTWRSTATHSYLDLETGAVVTIDDQARQALERVYHEMTQRGEQDLAIPLQTTLERYGFLQEQFRNDIVAADLVERGRGSRYIAIEPAGSDQDNHDAKAFVLTIDDPTLRDHLMQAIHTDGSLGRFQDLVYSDQEVHEMWYAFQGERTRQRVLDWLQDRNIEVIVL